jgi:hypothetical protein
MKLVTDPSKNPKVDNRLESVSDVSSKEQSNFSDYAKKNFRKDPKRKISNPVLPANKQMRPINSNIMFSDLQYGIDDPS